MYKAKVFENGRSQAVRLPKECRFQTDEVTVNRIGDTVILMPEGKGWENFEKALYAFTADFMEDGRADQMQQRRESI